MRLPSDIFRIRFLTFHSMSAGGFLEPPPKKISYSTFRRRMWSSNRESSSSMVKQKLHGQAAAGNWLGGLYHRKQRAPETPRCRQMIGLWIASNTHMGRPQSENQIRIVIADDHAVLRESLAALLSSRPEFAVEGWAANGQEALALVKEHHPDVLVLDLFMPESDGFEVLRTLDKAGSQVATVVLTGSESELDYAQAVKLGARGLVLKSDGPEKLFAAIRTVANGELAFSDELAQRVLSTMTAESKAPADALARLSDREKQIAYHVARGLKNKDIGQSLNISENTVKRHLQSIFTKTGARDRLELAVLALNEVGRAA